VAKVSEKPLVRGVKRALASRPDLYLNARRAFGLARWAARRPHESDFEFYRYAPPAPNGWVFLDVGANTGNSALSFRIYDKRTPIVSIEPNRALERDLKLTRRLIRGFDYHLVGAGDEHGEFTLYTPTYRGTPLSGYASLKRPEPADVWWLRQNVPDVEPSDLSIVEQRVEVVPLDELRLVPAHVKVDVEGMELEVLRGLRRTIAEYVPTILIERSERFEDVRGWLRDVKGYKPMTWCRGERRLVPYDPAKATQNAFFIAPARPSTSSERPPSSAHRGQAFRKRTTGLEPATFGLGSRRSTN
jgi:FkbM family methyltransferase